MDATSLTIPAMFVARNRGFRELVNYDKLGLVYPMHALTTLRPTLSKNPAFIESLIKSLIEATAVFQTNKRRASRSGGNTSEEFLEETYQYTSAELEAVPMPSVEVIKSAWTLSRLSNPQAKQTDRI